MEQNRIKYLLLSPHEVLNFIQLFPEQFRSMETLFDKVETQCSSAKE